ncbi:DUF4133 domain-containing protein [Niabella sp. CC-SYL272]|uniref:DUF4133 domain-containing protein n=1 Tax=Niabella agricola TaxID=2891571 RepID=UPI001F1AA598|nr:DUF4133 domain-containing protein [Niabella agricola]MCF3109605.1 DUF4133 domain-containing protein [Niabella agricola]
MANSTYNINKGINKPIEFKGLKAQYIAYLAVGLVSLLLVFAILYLVGFSVYVILPLVGTGGAVMVNYLYKYSRRYGPHGLMKEAAYRQVPEALKSRRLYTILQSSKEIQ